MNVFHRFLKGQAIVHQPADDHFVVEQRGVRVSGGERFAGEAQQAVGRVLRYAQAHPRIGQAHVKNGLEEHVSEVVHHGRAIGIAAADHQAHG